MNARTGTVLTAIFLPICYALNLGTHFGITVVAYQFSGFFAALMTFVLPFLSSVYWYISLTSQFGFLGHWWLICATGTVCMLGLAFAAASILEGRSQ